jgi:hypothetical protein
MLKAHTQFFTRESFPFCDCGIGTAAADDRHSLGFQFGGDAKGDDGGNDDILAAEGGKIQSKAGTRARKD